MLINISIVPIQGMQCSYEVKYGSPMSIVYRSNFSSGVISSDVLDILKMLKKKFEIRQVSISGNPIDVNYIRLDPQWIMKDLLISYPIEPFGFGPTSTTPAFRPTHGLDTVAPFTSTTPAFGPTSTTPAFGPTHGLDTVAPFTSAPGLQPPPLAVFAPQTAMAPHPFRDKAVEVPDAIAEDYETQELCKKVIARLRENQSAYGNVPNTNPSTEKNRTALRNYIKSNLGIYMTDRAFNYLLSLLCSPR